MPSELTTKQTSSKIPVFFLSGFLGSGKSTLLNDLLLDPEFHDTAVIINEFGDVAVDHLLVRRGKTSIAQVSTGCLCCSSSTDIRATLFDLHNAVLDGTAPAFSRVIVEMSGLGDPAPLINAMSPNLHASEMPRDQTVSDVFYLAGFNTLYDIVTGDIVVERHFEALKQVAFADRIILTKTDLAKDPATLSDIEALPSQLRLLNTGAKIFDRHAIQLSELFVPRGYSAVDNSEDVAGWLALETVLATQSSHHQSVDAEGAKPLRHGHGVQTFSLCHEELISEIQFSQFMSMLRSSAGPRLLRVKGIVGIKEEPDRPRIIHAVQHAVYEPKILDGWPDQDHSTRIVFIMDGIEPEPVRKLFSAIIDGRVSTNRKNGKGIANALRVSASNFSRLFGNPRQRTSQPRS